MVFNRYTVCGVQINALTPLEAAHFLIGAGKGRVPTQVHLCNAYTLSLVASDAVLRAALECSDLNLPDGTPVAWLGRGVGTSGPVRGPDLVADVVSLGRSHGLSHYFFGSAPGVAEKMADQLQGLFPGAKVVGTESPPFAPLSDADLEDAAARIANSGANILWLGIGTPRQDYLVPRLGERLSMPVVPVGAAFDFWAGQVPQAPTWMHGKGVEWLHRLASEPRRLWRRYLIGNPRFVINHLVSRRRNGAA